MPLPKLTRTDLIKALNRIGELAQQEEVVLEICLYGGAAMILAYQSREFTKDLDAIIRPAEVGRRLAQKVAEEFQVDEGWFDDNIKLFLAEQGTFAPLDVSELGEAARKQLRVTRASASYLLAMKCLAARAPLPGHPGDWDDIAFLLRKMNLKSVEEVEAHVERFYPFDSMSNETRNTIQHMLAQKQTE